LILILNQVRNWNNPENENENGIEALSLQRGLLTMFMNIHRNQLAFQGLPERRYSLEKAKVCGTCGKQACGGHVAVGDYIFFASQLNMDISVVLSQYSILYCGVFMQSIPS
jgi:hypothetical protein